METLLQSVNTYMKPPEKTIPEKCQDYIQENPGTVAKGAVAVGVVLYTAPLVISLIGWLPYIGVGYYIYKNTRVARQTYSGYEWAKSLVSGK